MAVTEVRALLAHVRDNEATERPMPPISLLALQGVMHCASKHLTILAPELGDQELIKSVAAELAKVGLL